MVRLPMIYFSSPFVRYVPKEQLTTALLLRLGRHEQKTLGESSPGLDLSDPQNERLKPRKTFGVMFDYNESRGQFHGIMWHIATAKGFFLFNYF